MGNIIDLQGNEINPPEMPLARTPTESEVEMSSLRLQAFDDGYIFRFTPHPTEEGRFVLFDVKNNPIGVIRSAPIAQVICDALRMLFAAVELAKKATPDNLVAACNTPEMLAGQGPVMES